MNMAGVIGLGSGRVKVDVCILSKRVAEEDIGGRSRSKFMQQVLSNPWITQIAKDMKFGVIGKSLE